MSDKSNRYTTSINLDRDLADWMDEENINRSDFLNEAGRLMRQNGSHMAKALRQHKIDELEAEAQFKQERANELKRLDEDEEQFDQAVYEEARENMSRISKSSFTINNPGIEKWAAELGMTENELYERLQNDPEFEADDR